jgi:transcriptional regulator with XRE-family HTH domain
MATNTQPSARAIGGKLRGARARSKISLRELAAKAEMSASMLNQIEHGKAFPSVRSIYNIAAAIGLPVDYFFPDETEPESAAPSAPMTASDLRQAHLNADENVPAHLQRPSHFPPRKKNFINH